MQGWIIFLWMPHCGGKRTRHKLKSSKLWSLTLGITWFKTFIVFFYIMPRWAISYGLKVLSTDAERSNTLFLYKLKAMNRFCILSELWYGWNPRSGFENWDARGMSEYSRALARPSWSWFSRSQVYVHIWKRLSRDNVLSHSVSLSLTHVKSDVHL